MEYREGTIRDLPAITELICKGDYYQPMNAAQIGGQWIVAEFEGRIVGAVWWFEQPPCAYVDYLYVKPKWRGTPVGARLVANLITVLRSRGIHYVRGVVVKNNDDSIRLVEGFGALCDSDYVLAYKEI